MLSLGETRPKPRQQAINSFLGNGFKYALKISRSSNDLVYKFNSECSRRRLCLLHEEDIPIATPAYNRDTAESRHGLLKQFQQLTTQFSGKARQPRNVSPWVGKAGDQPVSDWIGTARHHNRDGAVTFLASRLGPVPSATMMSTLRRTSSSARSGNRSRLPSADRYSMAMFCPTT